MMLYDRTWFHNDLYAVTIGGGFMNNPGRYLALTPPINGATAASGSPYFTQQPGQKLYQWDTQLNLQYMPKDWITWWTEATFRHSSVPYWSGSGGVTPPGGNNGSPASCVGGGADPTTGQCNAATGFRICAPAKSSSAPASWSNFKRPDPDGRSIARQIAQNSARWRHRPTNVPIPTCCWRRSSGKNGRRDAANCGFISARRPASARPTPCWSRRAKLASEGRSVLVGVVETHGRAETAALLEGLEVLPPKTIEYRGKTLLGIRSGRSARAPSRN